MKICAHHNTNTDEVKSYIENTNVQTILSEKEKEDCRSVDGLPVEFYNIFWTYLKSHLFNAIKESYKCNVKNCVNLCSAVLSLLFEKGEKHNLAKYRPISLCNTD